jgi:hypothetical protein
MYQDEEMHPGEPTQGAGAPPSQPGRDRATRLGDLTYWTGGGMGRRPGRPATRLALRIVAALAAAMPAAGATRTDTKIQSRWRLPAPPPLSLVAATNSDTLYRYEVEGVGFVGLDLGTHVVAGKDPR